MELFIIMIALTIGIIWGLYFKISIALILPLVFIVYLVLDKRIRNLKKYIIIFLIVSCISNINIKKLENDFNERYKKIINNEVQIIGTIISNPIEKEYNLQYILKVEDINNDSSFKDTKILIKIKKKNSKLKYGDKIKINTQIKEPEIQRNEGGFNYKQYLKTKKIYAIADVNKINLMKENNVNFIDKFTNVISRSISKRTSELLKEDEASILTAMLIGNKDSLNENIKEDFRKSSLSHILAISGMHVSYIIMGITFIINKTKVNKKISKIITILFLIFFIILTGKTPSVQRACIMSIYMILGNLLYKKTNILSSISISMIFILLENPYSILDIGLQLSYAGTLGIVIIYPILNKYKSSKIIKIKLIDRIIDIMLVTLSANIVLFPIILFHFNTISTTFLLSNLLVSPIIGIIIFLGFFTIIISYTFPFMIAIFSNALQFTLTILLKIANLIGNIPFSKIYLPTPKIYMIIIYYLTLFIILKYKKIIDKKIIKKIIAILLVFSILINIVILKIPKNLEIYFIDVGQGDSTLIITPNKKKILIDGGGASENSTYDVGKNILLPYLLDKQIINIDYIIFSHFDSDHSQGLAYTMQELKVNNVIIGKQFEMSKNYEEFIKIVKDKKIKLYTVTAGQKINIEKDLYFDILWPDSTNVISDNVLNNNSLVCKLEYKNFSMLFTGDIEEKAERAMLEKYKNDLRILKTTILKVAHHGSKTSSSKEFLKAIKPKIALIGVGKDNKFGHPNDGVLERLENLRSQNL